MSRRDVVIDQVGGIMAREGLKVIWDDETGDHRLFFDSAMILVTVEGDDDHPAVKIHCPMLFQVDAEGNRAAILARLNHLNGRYRFLKTYLLGSTVVSHYSMPAKELDAEDFSRALQLMVRVSEELDDTLMLELGGRRAVDVMEDDE